MATIGHLVHGAKREQGRKAAAHQPTPVNRRIKSLAFKRLIVLRTAQHTARKIGALSLSMLV
jgi:hypothetical protein